MRTICLILVVSSSVPLLAAADAKDSGTRTVREALWVWGNPEMAEEGKHSLATFAQAGPAERAELLGVPNIAMAGPGLPRNDEVAFALTAEVAHAPRLVWEIGCDDEAGGPPFEYEETVARIARVADKYPQLEGVLLDDMSSQKVARGFKPEHIRSLKSLLVEACPQVKVWGVVYTMNLSIPDIDDYLRELDIINLWVWHAKDLVDLEQHVVRIEDKYPDKPIVLGLYLYDYGDGRGMPLASLDMQCSVALKLLHEKRLQDLVLLTITNDEQAVTQAAEWVAEVGGDPIGKPSALERSDAPTGILKPAP